MQYRKALKLLYESNKSKALPDDFAIRAIVNRATAQGLCVEEIAELAKLFASSGPQLEMNSTEIADIASTGGPSSLSTLLGPLYLVSLGSKVVSLGAPGRPAGGVDVLAQIRGYKVQLTESETYSVMDRCRYVHFNAGNFAPLDAMVFKYRQKTGSQNIPDLVMVSLLSKKICVGANRIGLDVRVSPFGNFGASWAEASKNASKFNEASKLLGIESRCFLTNGSIPYQPFIGRGEALLALMKIFEEYENEPLRKHDEICFKMAKSVLDQPCINRPPGRDLMAMFADNIEAQGGSMDALYTKVDEISKSHKYQISSKEEGYLEIDLLKIRSILVKQQKKKSMKVGEFSDPCGIELKVEPGQKMAKGDLLASLRCDEEDSEVLMREIKDAFHCSRSIQPNQPHFEEISNG